MHRLFLISILAVAAFAAAPAAADEASDLAAIKAQLGAMQREYDSKIHALEARLAKAEADAKAARMAAARAARPVAVAEARPASPPPAAEPTQPATQPVTGDQSSAGEPQTVPDASPPPPPPAAPASNNAFNPGIAAVLNGFYVAATRDTKTQQIRGFATGDEAGLPPRGFSIGESEVSLAANVDPYISGFLDFAMHDDNSLSVEEAYIQTKDLPWGLTLKAGRFLSGIGYLNERHAHDWSFSDAPLPYRAFLDSQYGDDGLQVRWLAPTEQFLEFGAEIFRGDAYPAAGAPHNGQGTVSAFVHTGDDINDSSSYLAALSYLHTNAENRESNAPNRSGIFTGTDDLGFASFVYKWAPGGNPTVKNLTLSSEVFYGREAGFFDGIGEAQDRWGWYVQGVYQFVPQWSLGLRYSGLSSSDPGPALAGSLLDDFGHSPNAETALLEYDTSEFGRFRLQYTHDESDLKPNDEVLFQYTVIYGPHGAHRY
jgi:hypothetical protein